MTPSLEREPVGRVLQHVSRRSAVSVFVVTLIALPLLGLAGMVAADLVPDRLVMDRLFAATESKVIVEDNYPPGFSGGKVDRHSECKRMTVGLGDPPGVGTIESAIRSPTLGSCTSAVPKIVGWAQGDGLLRSYEYSRYWNGSIVVLRPAIVLFGVAGTRLIAAVGLVALGFVAWRGASRRLGSAAATAGGVVLVGTTDAIDLHGALLHAVAWAVILSTFGVVIRVPAELPRWVVAWLMAVLGAIFLYFGDMANPDAAWVVAVGALGLGVLRDRPGIAIAERMTIGGFSWIAGFTAMWASKWVFGALVYGYDDMRSNVSGAIETRLDGEHSGLSLTLWNTYDRVWDEWWKFPLTGWILASVLVWTVVATAQRGRADLTASWVARSTVSAVIVIPLVWYAILRNHTQIHAWFVYRSLAAAATIVVMAWVAAAVNSDRHPSHPGVDGIDEGSQFGVAALVEAEGDPG